MDNIVEIREEAALEWFANIFATAANNGERVRIMTGADNIGTYVKIARGGGMWSPPLHTEGAPLFEAIASGVVTVEVEA